jgi:hypothetical protein
MIDTAWWAVATTLRMSRGVVLASLSIDIWIENETYSLIRAAVHIFVHRVGGSI